MGTKEEAGIEKYDGTPIKSNKNLNSNKNQLVESLNNVITYISDSIAKKISKQISLPQSNDNVQNDNVQNGFNSVNNAVKTMATKSQSGGKKKKTVHFRLTSKNNTKKLL